MSRPRTTNKHLPESMICRRGVYYLTEPSTNGMRYVRLSRDRDLAIQEYRRLRGNFFDSAKPHMLQREVSRIYKKAQYNAAQRGLPFDLSMEEMMQVGENSRWRCALTKIAFSLDKKDGCKFRPFAPSLDRIDSSKGYSLDNCRLVCFAVNAAMNEWGEEVFRVIAASYCERRLPREWGMNFGNAIP